VGKGVGVDPHGEPLRLPSARGPLSSWVLDRLIGIERPIPARHGFGGLDDDAQLALYLCYDLIGLCLYWEPLQEAHRALNEPR